MILNHISLGEVKVVYIGETKASIYTVADNIHYVINLIDTDY